MPKGSVQRFDAKLMSQPEEHGQLPHKLFCRVRQQRATCHAGIANAAPSSRLPSGLRVGLESKTIGFVKGRGPTDRLPRSQYSSMSQDSRMLDFADVEASESVSLPPVPLALATCSVGSLCMTCAGVQL